LTQIRFSKNEITEIQQRLQVLSTNLDEENFIYDFLLSFGLVTTLVFAPLLLPPLYWWVNKRKG